MMKVIYISQGNIPSKWAHTMQAMKMAEALSKLVPGFRLVTQAHWSWLLRPRFDFEGWYGIEKRFRIVRLPTRRIPRTEIIEGYLHPYFDEAAVRYAARIGCDLVYTRSLHAAKMSVEAGLETLVEEHARTDYSEFRWLAAVKDNPRLLGVVTISNSLKDMYIDIGIPEPKIYVWPDGIDLWRFSDSPDRDSARKELGLPTQITIAMYCGHLYAHKGVSYIIEAARLVPEVMFYLVGGWPRDIAHCKNLAQGLKNIDFIGFVPNKQVPKYLAATDLLLLPNSGQYPEAYVTSPLKLFEYMAARRPIIATRIAALKGVLRHGENAFMVEPDSAAAIASAVRSVVQEADLSQKMVRKAWQEVQSYTWDKRVRAILRHFGLYPDAQQNDGA